MNIKNYKQICLNLNYKQYLKLFDVELIIIKQTYTFV